MEKVKVNTKMADNMRWTFNYAMRKDISDIYEAYEKPSRAKVNAWHYCIDLCKAYNGTDLRISGHNCMMFSATFKFVDPGTNKTCIAWITKGHDRYTEL